MKLHRRHLPVFLIVILVVTVTGAQISYIAGRMKPAEHPDSLPWKALGNPQAMTPLQGKEISLYGYMLPLEAGEEHTRFILSPRAPSCPFCYPDGVDSMVEVETEKPLPFRHEPVLLRGRLTISGQNHDSWMYGLKGAKPIPD